LGGRDAAPAPRCAAPALARERTHQLVPTVFDGRVRALHNALAERDRVSFGARAAPWRAQLRAHALARALSLRRRLPPFLICAVFEFLFAHSRKRIVCVCAYPHDRSSQTRPRFALCTKRENQLGRICNNHRLIFVP
jgi:hypothetical protein